MKKFQNVPVVPDVPLVPTTIAAIGTFETTGTIFSP
jgi:hypothetical protein